MADFLVEMLENTDATGLDPENKNRFSTTDLTPKEWLLFVDGASNEDGSGAGLLLIIKKGIEITYALRFEFPSTNNEAEYEAVSLGLSWHAK